MNTLTAIPTLGAYRKGNQLVVWCEHEAIWHYHGIGEGHRAAHCVCQFSTLRLGGYFIREVGPFTYDIKRTHKVRPHNRRCTWNECRDA